MRLDDLVPYAGNPRGNDKAVDAVAASIRGFGFRRAIICDREHDGGTPEHPVIVNGHTRVKALRSLGYDEIPDEWVTYTDGLSEDEVKALRLADNRTAERATWNATLLQHEVRGIRSLDMSRFGFDFRSKARPYGAERLRGDRGYNLDLVSAADCGPDGYPALEPTDARPKRLVGFNYARSTPENEKRGKGCHFFIDDYQFDCKNKGWVPVKTPIKGGNLSWKTVELLSLDIAGASSKIASGYSKSDAEFAKCLYRLNAIQWDDSSYEFNLNEGDEKFDLIVEQLSLGIPVVSTIDDTHTVNIIGLVQDSECHRKYILQVYDNNYPGETKELYIEKLPKCVLDISDDGQVTLKGTENEYIASYEGKNVGVSFTLTDEH